MARVCKGPLTSGISKKKNQFLNLHYGPLELRGNPVGHSTPVLRPGIIQHAHKAPPPVIKACCGNPIQEMGRIYLESHRQLTPLLSQVCPSESLLYV